MNRKLAIGLLTVGQLAAAGRSVHGQEGSMYPAPEMPASDRVSSLPLNTDGLEERLSDQDDGDEIEFVPEDIQFTKSTTVRDAEAELIRVDGLIVIDTHAQGESGSLAPALLKDGERMADMLRSIGIRPTILKGNDARPSAIRAHYARLREGRTRPHVLIFYSTSHGFSIPQRAPAGDRSHGHVLALDNGRAKMWHASVRKAMLSVRPRRLAVILTDSCSNVTTKSPVSETYAEKGPMAKEIIQSLFLNHTGVVDMNSSSLGQKSACDNRNGSDFTTALFRTIAYGSERQLDFASPDGNVSWAQVFRVTRQVVAGGSGGRQVPEAFSLARPK
jgi:hypothetical protein